MTRFYYKKTKKLYRHARKEAVTGSFELHLYQERSNPKMYTNVDIFEENEWQDWCLTDPRKYRESRNIQR